MVWTLAGTGVAGYANGPTQTAMFNAPCGIAVDSATGTLYVADSVIVRFFSSFSCTYVCAGQQSHPKGCNSDWASD